MRGIEKAIFIREAIVGEVPDKDAEIEAEMGRIADFTAQQVFSSTSIDVPMFTPGDLSKLSRRLTKVPPTQDHASKDERKGHKVVKGPKPILPARRHIELELSGI